jgi:hypothetical protein
LSCSKFGEEMKGDRGDKEEGEEGKSEKERGEWESERGRVPQTLMVPVPVSSFQ